MESRFLRKRHRKKILRNKSRQNRKKAEGNSWQEQEKALLPAGFTLRKQPAAGEEGFFIKSYKNFKRQLKYHPDCDMMSTVSGNILVSYSFRSAQTDVPDSNEKIKDIQDSRELQYPDLTAFSVYGEKRSCFALLEFLLPKAF